MSQALQTLHPVDTWGASWRNVGQASLRREGGCCCCLLRLLCTLLQGCCSTRSVSCFDPAHSQLPLSLLWHSRVCSVLQRKRSFRGLPICKNDQQADAQRVSIIWPHGDSHPACAGPSQSHSCCGRLGCTFQSLLRGGILGLPGPGRRCCAQAKQSSWCLLWRVVIVKQATAGARQTAAHTDSMLPGWLLGIWGDMQSRSVPCV